jgi:hypothetical protein
VTADVYGGVKSRQHSKEKVYAGFAYLACSKLGPVGHFGTMNLAINLENYGAAMARQSSKEAEGASYVGSGREKEMD